MRPYCFLQPPERRLWLVSSSKHHMIQHEETAPGSARRGLDWILEKILHQKGCQSLEQAAQGTDVIIIPGNV